MRVGCWRGWCFHFGFERPIPVALVDSFLHAVLAPKKGVS